MDNHLETLSVIANFLASASFFSGIYLYHREKTDSEIHSIQRAVIKFRSNVRCLDLYFRQELFNEMASCTVYSNALDPVYPRLLESINTMIKDYSNVKPKNRRAYLEECSETLVQIIRILPVSLSTSQVLRCEDMIEAVVTDALPFTPHFSGLEYISYTVYRLFHQLLGKYRSCCLGLDTWAFIFQNIIASESGIIDNVETLKNTICTNLVALQLQMISSHDQKDIDTVVKIVCLVCDSYLSKNTRQLKRLRRKKHKLMPFEAFDTYTEQFTEAQKVFRYVLSRDQEIEYATYVKAFETNNQ